MSCVIQEALHQYFIMSEQIIASLSEMPHAAEALLSYGGSNRIFIFYGDLGAGKTTLIKELCTLLGVKDTISSPTFSIVNEYQSADNLIYHFDFYRLKSEEEAFDLGYEEYFYSGRYCFIEWPQRIMNLLPETGIQVEIQLHSENSRLIKFKPLKN